MDTQGATLNGSELLLGDEDDNVISGGRGDDSIEGGGGDDRVIGGVGDDLLDGGAGDDSVFGGVGSDELVYNASENVDSTDVYQGGQGADTLTLELTREEYFSLVVQQDIAAYQAFIADVINRKGEAGQASYEFASFDLTVSGVEQLRLIVDGVEVTATDLPIIAEDDFYSVSEDGPGAALTGSVLDNDDAPNLVREVTLVSGPAKGVLVLNADGTFSFDPNGEFEGLAAGATEEVQFVYEAVDADGDTAQAVATITVHGVNDAPAVAAALEAAANEGDAAFTIDLLAGASDVDAGETATLTVANVSGLIPGVTLDGTTLSVDPSDPAFDGLAAGETLDITVSYDVVDAQGAAVAQTATITLTGTNDAPTVAAALEAAANEGDAAFTLDLLTGAADVDAGETATLTVANATGLTPGVTLDGATLSVDPSDPAFDSLAAGETREITVSYDVVDAQGAVVAQTATITLTGTNDAPAVAAALEAAAIEGDAAFTIDLLAGASDVDAGETATLTIVNVTGLTQGVTLDGTTLSVDPSDPAFDALAAGATLDITVSYGIIDAQGAAVAQTATVTLTGTNDAPRVAAVLEAAANEGDAAFTLDLLAGAADVDAGETATLTVANVSGLIPGVSLDGATLTIDPNDPAFDALAAGETRVITVAYDIIDAQGAAVAQTATVTLTGTNDVPTITGDTTGGVVEDDTLVATGALTVTDADTGQSAAQPQDGTAGSYGSFSITAAGDWTYTLDNANAAVQALPAGATLTETFTVTSFDGTASEDVVITITGVNDAPTVEGPLSLSATEDDPAVTLDLLTGASGDSTLSIANLTARVNGSGAVSLDIIDGIDLVGTTLVIDTENPNFDDFPEGLDLPVEINYDIVDEAGLSVSQTATLTLSGVNDAPTVFGPQTARVTEDDPASSINLLLFAQDPDFNDVLRVENISELPDGVTLNGNNLVVDTTASVFDALRQDEVREIAVTYDIVDAQGAAVAQTATIEVVGVNDAPAAFDGQIILGNEDQPVQFIPLNATDVDGNRSELTFALESFDGPGDVTVNASGQLFYTPPPNFNGDVTVFYSVTDAFGGSDIGSAIVRIQPVNDAPVASALAIGGVSGAISQDAVIASDIDGDTLVFSVLTGPSNGTASFTSGANFFYQANAGFVGTDSFQFLVSDGNGGQDVETVTINVVANSTGGGGGPEIDIGVGGGGGDTGDGTETIDDGTDLGTPDDVFGDGGDSTGGGSTGGGTTGGGGGSELDIVVGGGGGGDTGDGTETIDEGTDLGTPDDVFGDGGSTGGGTTGGGGGSELDIVVGDGGGGDAGEGTETIDEGTDLGLPGDVFGGDSGDTSGGGGGGSELDITFGDGSGDTGETVETIDTGLDLGLPTEDVFAI